MRLKKSLYLFQIQKNMNNFEYTSKWLIKAILLAIGIQFVYICQNKGWNLYGAETLLAMLIVLTSFALWDDNVKIWRIGNEE